MGEYTDKDMVKSLARTIELSTEENKALRQKMETTAEQIKKLEQELAVLKENSQWISVDDRLPEADYDCFVWYSCDTAFGKCKSRGIAHCSRCDWYTKHLDGDNIVVLYWMPCPEPPKHLFDFMD